MNGLQQSVAVGVANVIAVTSLVGALGGTPQQIGLAFVATACGVSLGLLGARHINNWDWVHE